MRFLPICTLCLAAVLHAQSTAPSVISRVDPEYSDEARRARVQSTVVLNILVGEDGKARDATVSQSAGFGLDEKALEAIRDWEFKPATKDGKPVAVAANVEMNFRLLVKDDKEDHGDQVSRIAFTLPEGAYKPELTIGKLPSNPIATGDQAMKIRFLIDTDGIPKNIVVLSSTDKIWEQLGRRVIQDWRFRPASLNGIAINAEATLELSHSSPEQEEAPLQVSLNMPGADRPNAGGPPFPLVRPISGLSSRVSHTANRLNNGTVLLAGGAAHKNETGPGAVDFYALASAQIYDWATRKIVNTSDLITPRQNHTATLLPDGTVLLVGGRDTQPLASAELYDPSTGKFAATGNLHEARESHTASLLPDGRVLICGGTGSANKYLTGAEIYDPRTRLFTLAGNMTTARTSFRAVSLNDGKVLLLGGFGPAAGTAEIYDPALHTFRATGNLTQVRYGFSATLLDSGQVLIVGGSASSASGAAMPSSEIYDPAAHAFHPTSSLAFPREFHNATLLANGKVLISGGLPASPGSPLTSTELFDPTSGTFAPGPTLTGLHTGHTVTQLQDGSVLVAGSGLIGNGGSAELLLMK